MNSQPGAAPCLTNSAVDAVGFAARFPLEARYPGIMGQTGTHNAHLSPGSNGASTRDASYRRRFDSGLVHSC